MEIRVLRYFLAVAREQNITAAAESLHLSQPTLSTQLKALEEELGCQLLVRGSKGTRRVTLTEDGMILRKRAEEVIALVDRIPDELGPGDGPVVGDVCIGAGETDGMRLFARAAKRLQEEHPQVRYHISSGNSAYVMEMLDKGLIDFALVYDNVDSTRYESVILPFADRWGVLMRRDDPLAAKELVHPQDLRTRRLIISRQDNALARISEWLGLSPDEMDVAATYNLVLNASILTSEGVGVTLCFDRLVSNSEGLVFRPLEPQVLSRPCLVWRRYQVFSKAVSLFLEALIDTTDGHV